MIWIQNTLQRAGYRNSTVRNQIIAEITATCGMFEAQQVIDRLPSVNRVTVYRTLDVLAALDIIHPTVVRGGAQYYELHQPENHHHHAMCTTCDIQQCVDCDVPNKRGLHHTLSYSFICTQCT